MSLKIATGKNLEFECSKSRKILISRGIVTVVTLFIPGHDTRYQSLREGFKISVYCNFN